MGTSVALVYNVGTNSGRLRRRLRIEGTRITVDRIATLYKQGQSAEGISQTYPYFVDEPDLHRFSGVPSCQPRLKRLNPCWRLNWRYTINWRKNRSCSCAL